MTFEDLALLEPRLAVLLAEARAYADDGQPCFCGIGALYGYGDYPGLKPRLLPLAGWGRADEHPLLSSSEAYNLAYDTINDSLPPCRNCQECAYFARQLSERGICTSEKRPRKKQSMSPNDPAVEMAILRKLKELPEMPSNDFHQRVKHILKCGLIRRLMLELQERDLVRCTRSGYYLTKWGHTAVDEGQVVYL